MGPDYKQFCPVAMAAEVVCTRWTMVVLRELIAGSTRFNEIRRGVPRMSPALLSTRLKELEEAGIVERVAKDGDGRLEYALTAAGRDLRPVVEAVGMWGQRWVDSELSLEKCDPSLLMWDMRRNLRVDPLPDRLCVVEFEFTDCRKAEASWWLVMDKRGGVDLCSVDPGLETDLLVTVPLRPMTAIWMGLSTVDAELGNGQLQLQGDEDLAGKMQVWLGLSPFAGEAKRADADVSSRLRQSQRDSKSAP